MKSADTPSTTTHARPGLAGFAAKALAGGLIGLVYLYRGTLGLFLGGHCRYHPTCSQYMIDAIVKHGPIRGTWRGVRRVLRCHPWGGGGHDPA